MMSRFPVALLLLAGLTLSTGAFSAGIAGFHPNCQTCHSATPPTAANANPESCHTCHGEKPQKGQVTVNGKTLNPHQGHFDVFNCTDCHAPHQASKNGCAECHKMDGIKMPDHQ